MRNLQRKRVPNFFFWWWCLDLAKYIFFYNGSIEPLQKCRPSRRASKCHPIVSHLRTWKENNLGLINSSFWTHRTQNILCLQILWIPQSICSRTTTNKNSQPSKHPMFQRRTPPCTRSRWTRFAERQKKRWKNGYNHTDGIRQRHTFPSLLSRIYCTMNLKILKDKQWHTYFSSADQWQINSRDVNC